MSSRRRTPRLAPEVRRRELLDAALDVILDRGFDALTVEAVARRAGVTRPVVYDLFGDLDALLLALIDREEAAALDPLLGIVGTHPGTGVTPEAFLVDAVGQFLGAVRARPRTWRFLLAPPRGASNELNTRIDTSRATVTGLVEALIDWGVDARGGPPGLDHGVLARLLVAAGEDAARLTLLHPRRFPAGRITALAASGSLLIGVETSVRHLGPAPSVSIRGPLEQEAVGAPGARLAKSQRRVQILDAAVGLIAENGFEALTMEAIARRVGVNRAVVYRSFANLEILMLAMLRRLDAAVRDTFDAALPAEPSDRHPVRVLGEALATLLEAAMQAPDTWRVALMRPERAPRALQTLVNRRRAALAKRLRPLMASALESLADPAPEMDVDLAARLLLSTGEEQARLALEDPAFPTDRLIEASWTFLSALLPRTTQPPDGYEGATLTSTDLSEPSSS
ncbi:MAG: TetR family transcriptional regulator [Solirubrobacteraceae bacterium]|nr:TetR family transcriptional regulator [Solirubrobacteraceae bacterium]